MYDYSLRIGVEDNPGSQGFHGLKYKISDDFLLMPKEGSYFFKTYLNCENKTLVDIEISGKKPDAIFINGKRIKSGTSSLKKGTNSVILLYTEVKEKKFSNHWETVDLRERSAVLFKKSGSILKPAESLSMKWYGQESILDFDVYGNNRKVGYYRFTAPPGLNRMHFEVYGTVKAYQDGEEVRIESIQPLNEKGLQSYELVINEVKKDFSEICFETEHVSGFYGGSAFPEPLELKCEKGHIKTGDWSEMGVLKAYSGGLWYRKNVNLSEEELSGNIFLDLGEVAASAEIHINGKKVGICLRKPFRIDITKFVKEGDNYFEILVYSTLANHYSTIPTPQMYRKSYEAGLIGPVKILWEEGN